MINLVWFRMFLLTYHGSMLFLLKVMTPNPECATLETTILDALHIMHDRKFLHIPVLDKGDWCFSLVFSAEKRKEKRLTYLLCRWMCCCMFRCFADKSCGNLHGEIIRIISISALFSLPSLQLGVNCHVFYWIICFMSLLLLFILCQRRVSIVLHLLHANLEFLHISHLHWQHRYLW